MRRINSGIRLMNEPRPSAKQVRTVAGSSRSNKKTKEITQTKWLALFFWLPTAVSNLNPPVRMVKNPKLTDEEKQRLVSYFNALIEMDRQTDTNATNETQG